MNSKRLKESEQYCLMLMRDILRRHPRISEAAAVELAIETFQNDVDLDPKLREAVERFVWNEIYRETGGKERQ
jgi:hypothetical protein